MITNISLTSVFVKDITASKRFYVDVLGFEEREDIDLGDFRWCTVGHPSQPELHLHLTTPSPPFSPEMIAALERALDEGGLNGPGLNVSDCRATVADLEAKGVTVLQQPEDRPYGVEALIRDNSGNWVVLVEPRDFDPAEISRESLGQ
ncbi:VOC family protein [Nocardioides aequoreus]|uniref:VOC family protein n=1 Tax=Nocardioides aequoreus TaxID=397278 RepID=UPI0004C459F2|nr:VOC family protein [Nocardioides aequoreus]